MFVVLTQINILTLEDTKAYGPFTSRNECHDFIRQHDAAVVFTIIRLEPK